MLKKDQIAQELISIITEDSTIEEIKETLKLCMDSLKSTTLHNLLSEDREYQLCQLNYLQAYRRYQRPILQNPSGTL